MELKTIRTSFLRGIRNGHHNTELKTSRHIIGNHDQNAPDLKPVENLGASEE